MSNLKDFLVVSDEVKEALEQNKPVVALESTIISHGMPYPQNVETALKVEQIIRDNGAIPATIAIINGQMRAGLSDDEIDYLGKKGREVAKVSRRDLPVIIAEKKDGATTVTTTMMIAHMAGIDVFATGGIGGVHLTLEYLETKGVPVLGYQTEELPAFYTRKSGFSVDYRVDSPAELAEIFTTQQQIGMNSGLLVTNPIPEQYAMDKDTIDAAIEKALAEAKANGIHGKESTPFLLAKVAEITGNNSLESNIQLVFNNVALGAKVAVEVCDRK